MAAWLHRKAKARDEIAWKQWGSQAVPVQVQEAYLELCAGRRAHKCLGLSQQNAPRQSPDRRKSINKETWKRRGMTCKIHYKKKAGGAEGQKGYSPGQEAGERTSGVRAEGRREAGGDQNRGGKGVERGHSLPKRF